MGAILQAASGGGASVARGSTAVIDFSGFRGTETGGGVYTRPPVRSRLANQSGIEIQRELVRMWPQARLADLTRHLVFDPCLDQVLGEDVALEQELVVALEVVQRLLERCGHAWHFGQLGRRQRVDILVERLSRIEPPLDAVE